MHNSKYRNREEFSDLILSVENLWIDFIGAPNFIADNEIRTLHVNGNDEIGASHVNGNDEIGATHVNGNDEIGASHVIGIDDISVAHDVGIDDICTAHDVGIDDICAAHDVGISLIRLAHHAGRIIRPYVLCTIPNIVHAPPLCEPIEYSHTHAKKSNAYGNLILMAINNFDRFVDKLVECSKEIARVVKAAVMLRPNSELVLKAQGRAAMGCSDDRGRDARAAKITVFTLVFRLLEGNCTKILKGQQVIDLYD